MSGKGFLGNMTENLHADCVQSRQAGFMQCFLNDERAKITPKDTCQVSCQHTLGNHPAMKCERKGYGVTCRSKSEKFMREQ